MFMPLLARVENGRTIVNEPTALPDGTEIPLVVNDEGDELSSDERRIRDTAITRALESVRQGKGRSAEELIAELRSRR